MAETSQPAIQTERLTKYYGQVVRTKGIENVSLSVETGDFFGFIGPNGAGKSTTIRILLGLIAPTAGRAQVFGRDVGKDRVRILADVGYLPAEAAFYSGMRVRDVLQLSARLHRRDCRQETALLCERLELDVNKKVDELSLGNRKKVGIVCALQHKPSLYILDEPTSGLDPLMQREFYALLQERNREGATVFLSSHVLSEVARYCRHAGIIRQGELIAVDAVEKLCHAGVKRVTLRGTEAVPPLAGIRDVRAEDNGVTFLFSGQTPELIRALAGLPFDDMTVADPDLEEIFLHYYAKGGDPA